jgi:hypothetical protein
MIFNSPETSDFEDYVAKLNREIALRNDFVVFALEVVSDSLSPELYAHSYEWAAGSGFVTCICNGIIAAYRYKTNQNYEKNYYDYKLLIATKI